MSDFADELLSHVQSVAISFGSWRGTARDLAGYLAKSLGTDNRIDEIRRHLHSKPMATALNARDVLLWRGGDGLIRLVDASPVSKKAASLRVQHHPGPNACRYCLMQEHPSVIAPELVQECDGGGEHIAGSFVHKACATAWSRLRQQAGE